MKPPVRRCGQSGRAGRALHGARGLKRRQLRHYQVTALSRPSRGAWIETRGERRRRRTLRSRPSRGAWIETPATTTLPSDRPSRPSRGAWIETSAWTIWRQWWRRRALHGARGLKQRVPASRPHRRPGRALHGARGLKPTNCCPARPGRSSRPSRGAWIETASRSRAPRCPASRALHGARGLKHRLRRAGDLARQVAPFTGRVD